MLEISSIHYFNKKILTEHFENGINLNKELLVENLMNFYIII